MKTVGGSKPIVNSISLDKNRYLNLREGPKQSLEKTGSLASRLERKHFNDHIKEVRLEVHGPPFG